MTYWPIDRREITLLFLFISSEHWNIVLELANQENLDSIETESSDHQLYVLLIESLNEEKNSFFWVLNGKQVDIFFFKFDLRSSGIFISVLEKIIMLTIYGMISFTAACSISCPSVRAPLKLLHYIAQARPSLFYLEWIHVFWKYNLSKIDKLDDC